MCDGESYEVASLSSSRLDAKGQLMSSEPTRLSELPLSIEAQSTFAKGTTRVFQVDLKPYNVIMLPNVGAKDSYLCCPDEYLHSILRCGEHSASFLYQICS